MLTEVIDSNGLRVAGYVIAGVACALAFGYERYRGEYVRHNLWPRFWILTAALFLFMALARLGEVGSFLADVGRRQARTEGWYESRRPIQAVVVGATSATWLILVCLAILRVPERRRRYLPTATIAFTLVCFAGVRITHCTKSMLSCTTDPSSA